MKFEDVKFEEVTFEDVVRRHIVAKDQDEGRSRTLFPVVVPF